MKIPEIKKLVESTIEELVQAEVDILNEVEPQIEVGGADEGEKLTHIMAAIWIKNDMNDNGSDLNKAIRNYSVKVRNSIS
jgi:hypothetical protein